MEESDKSIFERTLTEIINSIKDRKLAIFCGAGISYNSGLPLANSIIKYILEKTNIPESEIEVILRSNFPFEAFFKILFDITDISKIYNIFDIRTPNRNHVLIAKLAKLGCLKVICTTNFDSLIEEAFILEKLSINEHYDVIYKESDFEKITWDDDKIKLIKIHGNIDDKDSIVITLDRVAKKLLSESRRKILEYIFQKGNHSDILVLGYSCSDVFDISPHIASIKESKKQVFIIEHTKDGYKDNESSLKIESITKKKNNNPFISYEKGKRIFIDTDVFIQLLWDNFLSNETIPKLRKIVEGNSWESYIDDWFSGYTYIAPNYIPALIYFNISRFDNALEYFNKCISIYTYFDQKALINIYRNSLLSG